MKTLFLSTLFMTLLALPAFAADLTGTWKGQISDPQATHDIVLQLKMDGDKITGTLAGGPPTGAEQRLTDVKLTGDQLSFTIKAQGMQGENMVLVFKGKVTGNHIKGTHEAPMGSVPWEVTKE